VKASKYFYKKLIDVYCKAVCHKLLMTWRMYYDAHPCIVIHSYSATKKMHRFLTLFILVKRSTCFGRSFRPSSGAQNCTHGNRLMSNSCCFLLLAAAVWHMPVAVCAVLSS